jgi:hypothetical protein
MWPDAKRRAPMKRGRANPPAFVGQCWLVGVGALLLVVLLAGAVGCGTPVRFAPVDLKEPGWTVRRGEAVWRRKRGGDGIAAEFLAATRPDGRAFVQLSKDAFPLAVGQTSLAEWSVEFPLANGHYSGRGPGPNRVILLQLPRVLAGLSPPKGITWAPLKNGGWRLENMSSGESLDVFLDP